MTHVLARLNIDRDNLENGIKCRKRTVESLRQELINELNELNARREALVEVNAAIEKLKAE
ncbi:hypothetical protein BN79_070 [Yersinia phage phiR2-01]|uniref:Uncharacterized protein n=1 Tax=Yersinia phage phiR2-01 TaxID=1206557 RepID=I7K2M6_9CAUD|nr:hypothetical protein BN79_070 [Yersinia phage phiR2-01]CCI88486.1 hypothetical protein BN79_070 [Yersinia phage phiR2-01]